MAGGNLDTITVEALPSTRRTGRAVLLSGVGTSLATLGLLLGLNALVPDLAIMSWYASYVIPFGPIMVGLAAASGYGIAGWLTGGRLTKRHVLLILLLQVGCFFASHYVEYVMVRNILLLSDPLSFWEYFDAVARGFSFDSLTHAGPAFGVWGYGMRLVEIAAFSLCALVMMALPFAQTRRA